MSSTRSEVRNLSTLLSIKLYSRKVGSHLQGQIQEMTNSQRHRGKRTGHGFNIPFDEKEKYYVSWTSRFLSGESSQAGHFGSSQPTATLHVSDQSTQEG